MLNGNMHPPMRSWSMTEWDHDDHEKGAYHEAGPNGKPLSGASGAAEFASSAIACWLKPRRNASARLSLRAPRTTREAAVMAFVKSWRS